MCVRTESYPEAPYIDAFSKQNIIPNCFPHFRLLTFLIWSNATFASTQLVRMYKSEKIFSLTASPCVSGTRGNVSIVGTTILHYLSRPLRRAAQNSHKYNLNTFLLQFFRANRIDSQEFPTCEWDLKATHVGVMV